MENSGAGENWRLSDRIESRDDVTMKKHLDVLVWACELVRLRKLHIGLKSVVQRDVCRQT